jgi:hypothetical protein
MHLGMAVAPQSPTSFEPKRFPQLPAHELAVSFDRDSRLQGEAQEGVILDGAELGQRSFVPVAQHFRKRGCSTSRNCRRWSWSETVWSEWPENEPRIVSLHIRFYHLISPRFPALVVANLGGDVPASKTAGRCPNAPTGSPRNAKTHMAQSRN